MPDLSTNTFQSGKSFKLKRCPFCPTGVGEFKDSEQMRDGYMTLCICVRCAVCKASTRRVTYSVSDPHGEELAYKKAANLWNRRS